MKKKNLFRLLENSEIAKKVITDGLGPSLIMKSANFSTKIMKVSGGLDLS